MKVFLGGHGFLPYTYSWDGIIPENMKAELSQLIENDDEIMYFENTYGETPIKNYFDEIKYKNAFSYKAENGMAPIVNKADYALISFVGYERSCLQEIISFLYLGKKCKLYFPDEDKLMEVFELEDLTELVAEFECVSERLQSQHFLTLIHSNAAWEADPVNIFQFIISAYVLPGFVNKDSLVKMPREKLVRDNAKGKRYLLDSIHFHSDIYFDIKELQHNIGKLFFELLFD